VSYRISWRLFAGGLDSKMVAAPGGALFRRRWSIAPNSVGGGTDDQARAVGRLPVGLILADSLRQRFDFRAALRERALGYAVALEPRRSSGSRARRAGRRQRGGGDGHGVIRTWPI